MNGLEPLIPVTFFLVVGAVVILRGPFGRALADRLAGRTGPGDAATRDSEGAHSDAAQLELEQLRYRVTELEERQDFTERMLAQHAERQRIDGRG